MARLVWTGDYNDQRATAPDGRELRVRRVGTVRRGYWRTSIDGIDTHPRGQGYDTRDGAKRALSKKAMATC